MWLSFLILTTTQFLRRIGRAFRRVSRRIARSFRRVTRYQRRFAKTDAKIFGSIQQSSAKHVKAVLDKKGKTWGKEKDIKKEVKNKVALEIEKELQISPMRDMRSLVDKTIDETINLALLEEISRRGDQLNITRIPPIFKYLGNLIFPLVTAGVLGIITAYYPDRIPPGSLIIIDPNRPPTGGNPPPIDPIQVAQSALVNAAVYGIGALALVGIIALIRRR
jgi:hypothetical protein